LLALIALAVAAAFVTRTHQQITIDAANVRTFDLHARETADALADLRASEQAYVAAGQGSPFWMSRVDATTRAVRDGVLVLRQSAASADGRAAMMEAEAAVGQFDAIDKRAREYLKTNESLMASDVIFTEGGEAAAVAARLVERARIAERQALDSREALVRSEQAIAFGAGASVAVLVVLLLSFGSVKPEAAALTSNVISIAAAPDHQDRSGPRTQGSAAALAAMLKTTAEISTDFGRIRELSDLRDLLARVAAAMDASGVVVWLGSTGGADLQPIVSHGYAPSVIARMPAVPRTADNAAAAAYRSGALQIVMSRPGRSAGALVAPLLTPEGCVGAFSAETRHGGEASQAVQALATIFAAHLAGVFAATASESGDQKAIGGAG